MIQFSFFKSQGFLL